MNLKRKNASDIDTDDFFLENGGFFGGRFFKIRAHTGKRAPPLSSSDRSTYARTPKVNKKIQDFIRAKKNGDLSSEPTFHCFNPLLSSRTENQQ